MVGAIILSPLVGFLVNGLAYLFFQCRPGGRRISAGLAGTVATGAIFLSFLFGLYGFLSLQSLPADARWLDAVLFEWIRFEGFQLDFTLRLDALSSLFVLVITGVGTLIHLYSIGYMHDDEGVGKYFAYLNLFCAAMLTLVLGASLPVTFMGWEGVGLCSYLLIGFWYQDTAKAIAGKKAFVVNRIGDLGFLLAMFTLFGVFGTLDYAILKDLVANQGVAPAVATAACLFLFLGCTGKSAQIPLYVWLPDAMAGPTPVSALIHAATMVTSGIYLVARMSYLFLHSPVAMLVMAWVGVLTAFFAASMAFTQTDIKKVLAYSTVSQLGYMFLACGVGAFDAGVFHVITHAFFKALMFLGAGSVIYGMHHEQDILKMGGLKKYMPITFWTFLLGWLAISGVPPFAGFFSKDEILWKAWSSSHGSKALWAVGTLTAMMTAFYMTRLFSLTFLGSLRESHDHDHAQHKHDDGHGVHESPAVMTIPLVVLAFLSVVGGWIGIPHMSWLEHWLEPTLFGEHAASAHAVGDATEWILMAVNVLLGAGMIVFGLSFYKSLKKADEWQAAYRGFHRILLNKWYVDEMYEATIVRPILRLSKFLWSGVDVAIIDRAVVGLGRASAWTGQSLRAAQTGTIQVYMVAVFIGMILTLGYLIHGLA